MCQSKFTVLGYSTLSAYSKKFYILKTIVSFFGEISSFSSLQYTRTDPAVSYRFHSPRQRWDWIMVNGYASVPFMQKNVSNIKKKLFFSNYQEIKIAYKTKTDNRLFFVKTVLLAKPSVSWYFAKPIICFYKYTARFRVQFLRNLNERHSIYICIHS